LVRKRDKARGATPQGSAPRSLSRRLLRWALRGLGAGVACSVVLVLGLRFVDPPTSAMMVARRLEATGPFVLKQQWVPRARISSAMQLAVIAAEDQKFPDHHGFDVEAIEDALEDHLEGRSSRGASTLTQQVAKNLFLWAGHSWVRKGLEAWFTVLLEALWSKGRILEVYLNVAELGPGVFGVEAAARVNFNKPAASLNAREAALLAGVLPNPRVRKVTAPTAQVAQRVGWIEDQARRLGLDTLDGL
jgi:monofunctional biosynthetic peptidoglycan transglycosylase